MTMQRISIVSAMSKEGAEYFNDCIQEMRSDESSEKEVTAEDMKNMGFEVKNGW